MIYYASDVERWGIEEKSAVANLETSLPYY